ncbi:MAG TPA: BrxA/BrxB family bacilliredoxin [Umezawaea sp.]|nr:BrxA/BrxB family bacilliredoxin [Umezawaea sp.]
MPYSPLLVKPMKDELIEVGFTELLTTDDVDRAMDRAKNGITLVVINSAEGTPAMTARLGVRIALDEASTKPDKLITVFAGQDMDATARMRAEFPDIPPSEPSIALFQDGELVHFVPCHRIQGRDARQVAEDLKSIFKEYCR